MGREIKRVTVEFNWPLNEIWWGFLSPINGFECKVCNYTGKNKKTGLKCGTCKGDGELYHSEEIKRMAQDEDYSVEPPEGEAYQLWETVSEGSPVSPPFVKPEDLADWLTDNHSMVGNRMNSAQWLKFIAGPGWAPSFVIDGGKFMSGVEAIAESE